MDIVRDLPDGHQHRISPARHEPPFVGYACNMRHHIVDAQGREVVRGPEWKVRGWADRHLDA